MATQEDGDLYLSSDEESIDAEDIVVQGFRQARNRTNWRYRGTAMTTTDAMDIDGLRLQAHDYETVLAYIASAFAAMTMMAKSRMEQSLPYQYIKDAMDYLSVAIAWIVCYIEMIYMDIEDKLYYVHTVRPLPEPNLRSIHQVLDDNESESLFGFKKNELELLLLHWRIPLHIRENNRPFTGEEAMLVFLYYIRHSTTYIQMADQVFGGDPRLFTYYVRAIANHLYIIMPYLGNRSRTKEKMVFLPSPHSLFFSLVE